MRRACTSLIVAAFSLAVVWAGPAFGLGCTDTPRPAANPFLEFQEQAFGFHDEELILCSPGFDSPTHLAARLWVPAECPGTGGCAGVVMAHGFGFSKEITFADMLSAVRSGFYVLSYDVRGQGASGGQAEILGRNDIADQAAVLDWWHANVAPTKTAFYGISQGGWLSWTAAIFNCGAARAAEFDSSVACGTGGRWIDAVAPMQAPASTIDDGTCTVFQAQAFVESRANPAIASSLSSCVIEGSPGPIPGAFVDVATRMDRVDVPVYAVTSFYDRLVPPRLTSEAYEHLHARSLDLDDDYYGTDVRLLISNDGHGDVGGNVAVTGDVFAWLRHHLSGGPALRNAKVAIAQEWAAGTFRLEEGWPIPASTTQTLFLSRDSSGELGSTPAGAPDELRNIPMLSTPPNLPGGNALVQTDNDAEIPGARLVFKTAPFASLTEITGEPVANVFVSSADASGSGRGQLNLGLYEVRADGTVHEFSHARVGLTGLGPVPEAIEIPLSLASHRIDEGNSLMLTIASSDLAVAFPAVGIDPFFVHHDMAAPSSLTLPIASVFRAPPPGDPPAGAAYTDDPVGAICEVFGLPC